MFLNEDCVRHPHHCWSPVIEPVLEALRQPVRKVNGALRFDYGHRSARANGTTLQTHTVFSAVGNARDHQGGRLRDRHGDLCHRKRGRVVGFEHDLAVDEKKEKGVPWQEVSQARVVRGDKRRAVIAGELSWHSSWKSTPCAPSGGRPSRRWQQPPTSHSLAPARVTPTCQLLNAQRSHLPPCHMGRNRK